MNKPQYHEKEKLYEYLQKIRKGENKRFDVEMFLGKHRLQTNEECINFNIRSKDSKEE